MAQKPRIVVVGYGAIGRHHARNLSTLPEADFLGVVDDSDAAHEEARANGFEVFPTLDAAVKCGIDAVVLSVPTSLHYEMALWCLERGFATLVEKPIAMNADEGAKIIAAASARQVPLMVGYVERYNPAVVALRNFIRSGALGAIYGISARRVGTMPARIKDANVLIDIGVHDIDMAAFLLDSDLVLRSALGGRAQLTDRLDFAFLALQGGGVPVHIESNWITPVKAREIFVTGANGLCHVDYVTQTARFAAGREFPVVSTYESVVEQYRMGEFVDLPIEKEEPLRRELRTFIAGMQTGDLPDPSLSLVSLRIAQEATALIDKQSQKE